MRSIGEGGKSIVKEAVHDGVRNLTVRWNNSVLPFEQVLLTAPAAVTSYLKRKKTKEEKALANKRKKWGWYQLVN